MRGPFSGPKLPAGVLRRPNELRQDKPIGEDQTYGFPRFELQRLAPEEGGGGSSSSTSGLFRIIEDLEKEP
jgi:hypothetical protein